jgi:hypothetical protein
MNLIFTVCSANQLHQAQCLGKSIQKQNPDYEFVIGLVDVLPTSFSSAFRVVSIKEIASPFFEQMKEQFTCTELVAACKPAFASYFFKENPTVEKLICVDPWILVTDSLSEFFGKLEQANILLTPNISEAIDLKRECNEMQFLNEGLYSSGFIGIKRSETTFAFLGWWQTHILKYGYLDYEKGMGSDQLCLNFVPLFYDKVSIDFDPAYNVAFWNLSEKNITYKDGTYWINGQKKMVFFNFKGYSFQKPERLSIYWKSASLKNFPVLKPFVKQYQQDLLAEKASEFISIIPAYGRYVPAPKELNVIEKGIKSIAKTIIDTINRL